MNTKKILSLFLITLFLFLPVSTQAGIVPCGNEGQPECNICFMILGIKKLIDWGMAILATAAILAIFASGIMYVVSAGDSGMMESAKKFMYSAFLGVVFFLGAWLLITVTIWILGAKIGRVTERPWLWHEFSCETPNDVTVP